MKKILAGLALVTILVSCGGRTSHTEVNGITLQGTWARSCEAIPGVGSYHASYRIIQTRVVFEAVSYSDQHCQKTPKKRHIEGTFTLGKEIPNSSGAKEIDLTFAGATYYRAVRIEKDALHMSIPSATRGGTSSTDRATEFDPNIAFKKQP